MEELLTTRQVAKQLRVSESSVKRWCDQGIIKTQRTVGGHRRITRDGLAEFLATSSGATKQTAFPPPTPSAITKPPAQVVRNVKRRPAQERSRTSEKERPRVAEALEKYATASQHEYIDRFQQALVAGNETLCRDLVEQWLSEFTGFAQLGDVLIAQSMERIGRLRECGRAEIFEERRSYEICRHLLSDLRHRAPACPPRAPRAIGATPAGDHNALASQLVELVLREASWNATNLGSDLPLDAILAAVRRETPRMLWLSISRVENRESFISDYNEFFSQLPAELVVAVAGSALTDQLRPHIGYTAHCDNLEQLSALAQVVSRAR